CLFGCLAVIKVFCLQIVTKSMVKKTPTNCERIELFSVQECFFLQEGFFRFHMVFIRDTAVYGTYCGTLWFFMKAFTFGTFIGYYKINIVTYGFLRSICIYGESGSHDHRSLQGSAF